jgi:hypothetical protein
VKPLKPHAVEMLRLIAGKWPDAAACYWSPSNRDDYFTDQWGCGTVYVYGAISTGAIRALTARGLVEKPIGATNKWSRRITPAGRTYLEDLMAKEKRPNLEDVLEEQEAVLKAGWPDWPYFPKTKKS